MSALEQFNKIPIVQKIVVLVVLLALLAGGYWFFFYSESADDLEGLQNEYSSFQKKKKDALKRKSTYDRDRHRRDELKRSYAQQLRALPSESEMSSFINHLNANAELVGLELLSLKPQKEQVAQYYAKIPVHLKLKGSFHQLAKFFYLVGNVDRIINIENIKFTVASVDDSGVLLTASVLATTFRSVQPTEKKTKKKKKKKRK